MGNDKKEKLTLKLLAGWIRDLAEEVKEMQSARIPVNACAEREYSTERVFRVITNGKKYGTECSRNEGKTWAPEFERKQLYRGSEIVPIERRSYRAVVRCIRKEYGTAAIILEREWRAV